VPRHRHSHEKESIDDHVEPMSLSSPCDATPKQAKRQKVDGGNSHMQYEKTVSSPVPYIPEMLSICLLLNEV
jgi:hypothetical protein